MNYIQEIKSFNDWLVINPSVTSDDIVLWYALMNLNNINGWHKEFTVAISTIMDRTRLSRSAIYRSRNRLVQMNRLIAKERTGNQCAVYQIISFYASQYGTHNGTQVKTVSPNGTQPDTQLGTQSGTQTGTEPGTINKTKLDETKQNNVGAPVGAPEIKPVKKIDKKKNKEPATPFWEALVKVWFDYNKQKFGDDPSFAQRDPSYFRSIVQRLRKRAEKQNVEWTEPEACKRLKSFLDKCYSDKWLSTNFLLNNILNQFDKLQLNQKNGTYKQTNAKPIPEAVSSGGFGNL